MEYDETGTWDAFEAWLRLTLGSNFRWKVGPTDTAVNRRMIADLVQDELTRNQGRFPANNAFIECLNDAEH